MAEQAAAHTLWSSVETALQQALQQAEGERVAPHVLLESELHSSTARNHALQRALNVCVFVRGCGQRERETASVCPYVCVCVCAERGFAAAAT